MIFFLFRQNQICIVAASANYGKSGNRVVGTILPLLSNVGITHTVAEIRSLSMKTLSEIIDSSGSILTPHLSLLIPCLLKASGELEVPKLSYMSTQLSANADAQEMIDSVRAEVVKQHHTTETLSKVSFNFLSNFFLKHLFKSFVIMKKKNLRFFVAVYSVFGL